MSFEVSSIPLNPFEARRGSGFGRSLQRLNSNVAVNVGEHPRAKVINLVDCTCEKDGERCDACNFRFMHIQLLGNGIASLGPPV